jgi:hypothetical protein
LLKEKEGVMQVSWNKCKGDDWCRLNNVNLNHNHFDGMEGVYIIWHGGANAKTVRVGQGVIRDRLAAHRSDPDIQEYARDGLFVTWTRVSAAYQDGVEAYLANQLNPLVGQRFPNITPLLVNLPW